MLFNASVKDYSDFSEIFGTKKRRYNKVLLSFWKYRHTIDGDARATQIRSMKELYQLVIANLQTHRPSDTNPASTDDLERRSYILDMQIYSRVYHVVGKGLPNNEDENCILCTNLKTGKNYNIRAGKFFRELIKDYNMKLDEATITYCSEEFQRLWKAYAHEYISNLTLHVDKHFDYIYSQEYIAGSLGSCMVGKNQYSFYNNYVDASAAYLTNSENKIVARCVVFHNVTDSEGNVHNYAERQYSIDGDDCLKQILVNKLIAAGYIDIYKSVGAGCRCIDAICNLSGKPANCVKLSIPCNVQLGDTVAFMDTFIYYDEVNGVAKNYMYPEAHFHLGHTASPLANESHRL